MKNKIFAFASLILLISACAALPTDSKSWNIMIPLTPGKKLAINLVDKSGFNVDIENPANDTLIIRGANYNKPLVNDKVSLSVLDGNLIEILNVSKKNVKPTVRVYNHKAKVITAVTEIK